MPGLAEHIHLNNAGASPAPHPVLQKQLTILQREQLIGGYAAMNEYADELEHTRSTVAGLIGARNPTEIALMDSATTAWVRAFYSIRLEPGDVVLTCEAEYAANYVAMLQQCNRHGATIECVASDHHGVVDVAALDRRVLAGGVKAICITHVPTNGHTLIPSPFVEQHLLCLSATEFVVPCAGGLVNPAAAIGAIASNRGIVYLLDACQSIGQIDVDVQAIKCDFLSATGRKYLRGPRGTGFLFVRNEMLTDDRISEPITIDHHAAPWSDHQTYQMSETAQRYEQWESNFAGLVALGVAVDYARSLGLGWIQSRVQALAAALREKLRAIGAIVHDLGTTQCGIVSFELVGLEPDAVKTSLVVDKIYITVTGSGSTRIDATRRNLPATMLRASVHYFNVESELDTLVARLQTHIELKTMADGVNTTIGNTSKL